MGSRDHSETCEVCGIDLMVPFLADPDDVSHLGCRAESDLILYRLASNLAVAGALCAAFAMGQRAPLGVSRDHWRPGCGRNAGGGR